MPSMPPDSANSPGVTPEAVTWRLESLMRSMGFRNRASLSVALGYSRSQLYAIEKGEVPVTRKFLISLEALEAAARDAAAAEQPVMREGGPKDDAVARLLRGLDFSALCSVLASSTEEISRAGCFVPEAARQIHQALDEMQSRQPGTKNVRYIPINNHQSP